MITKHPNELGNHHRFYEMSVTQKQEDLFKRIRFVQMHYPEVWFNSGAYKYPYYAWWHLWQGLMPGVGLNYSMFQSVVNCMANEEQKQYWMPLINKHKILGCYA